MEVKHLPLLVIAMLLAAPISAFGSSEESVETAQLDGEIWDEAVSLEREDLSSARAELGFSFVENRGQVSNPEVLYYAHGDLLSVGLTVDGAVITVRGQGIPDSGPRLERDRPERLESTFRFRFHGCNPVIPTGTGVMSIDHNYYYGSEPDRWVEGARSYEEVQYPSLYDGIDLRFYFSEGMFKYDLIVSPGADPSIVTMAYEGVDEVFVDELNEDLIVSTRAGPVRDMRPIIFQDHKSVLAGTFGTFEMVDDVRVRLKVPASVDTSRGYVIDPGLRFSTYLGGSAGFDNPIDVHVDSTGNVYVFGDTASSDFPTSVDAYDNTHEGSYDLFIMKFDPTLSTILYSTFIGGAGGHQYAEVLQDAHLVDGVGMFITGYLNTNDFPVTPDALHNTSLGNTDAFITKFSMDGRLVYSSFLGGSGGDYARTISMDSDGKVYLAGSTTSNGFPTTAGAYCETYAAHKRDSDLFIMALAPSLDRIVHCSLVAGSDNDRWPELAIAPDGSVYCCGLTESSDFPITSEAFCQTNKGGRDAFFLRMSNNLTELIAACYMGTPGYDIAYDVVIGSDSTVYLAALTEGDGFPLTPDAFNKRREGLSESVIIFTDENFTTLQFCSFLGGDADDAIWQLELSDDERNLIIAGYSDSTDLNTTKGAYDLYNNGDKDMVVAVVNTVTRDLDYLSYLGGSGEDYSYYDGAALRADGSLVMCGVTISPDFPTTRHGNMTGPPDPFLLMDGFLTVFDPAPCPVTTKPTLGVEPGNGFVNLSWELDIEWCKVYDYWVYRGNQSRNLEFLTTATGGSYNDTDVVNGVTYYYQVAGNNSVGVGVRSTEMKALPLGFPSPPTLSAASGDGTVRLNWTPPIDSGGGGVLGYRIFRSLTPHDEGFTHIMDLGNVTKWTDRGLELGIVYYYKVMAFNQRHDGSFSNRVQVKAVAPPGVPELFETTPGDSQVLLEWSDPPGAGGSVIISFRIYRGLSLGTFEVIANVLPDTFNFTDIGLTNGVTYYYHVRAISTDMEGEPTEVLAAMPFGPPSPPENLTATSGDRQVHLRWDRPGNNGSATLQRYLVYAGSTGDDLALIDTTKMTEYVHTSLDNGVQWYYAVSAENIHGEGHPSKTVPGIPIGLPSTPTGFAADGGLGEVTLSWEEPSFTSIMGLTHYLVLRGTDIEPFLPRFEVDPTNTTYVDTDVENGVTYFYSIAAVNVVGESEWSPTVSAMPSGRPTEPTNLDFLIGDATIVLAWNPPRLDGGSSLTGYVILRGTTEMSMEVLDEVGVQLHYTVTGVDPDSRFLYSVAARNGVGTGEMATPVLIEFQGRPGDPREVSAVLGDRKVKVTWSEPGSDGGSPLTGYLLLRGSANDSLSVIADLGLVSSYTDDTVEDGLEYWYAVRAVNERGPGSTSGAVPVAIPEREEKTDEQGVPAWAIGTMVALFVLLVIIGMMASRTRVPPPEGPSAEGEVEEQTPEEPGTVGPDDGDAVTEMKEGDEYE